MYGSNSQTDGPVPSLLQGLFIFGRVSRSAGESRNSQNPILVYVPAVAFGSTDQRNANGLQAFQSGPALVGVPLCGARAGRAEKGQCAAPTVGQNCALIDKKQSYVIQ